MIDKVTITIDSAAGLISVHRDPEDALNTEPLSRAELIAQIVGPIICKLMTRPTEELKTGVLADVYSVAGATNIQMTAVEVPHDALATAITAINQFTAHQRSRNMVIIAAANDLQKLVDGPKVLYRAEVVK